MEQNRSAIIHEFVKGYADYDPHRANSITSVHTDRYKSTIAKMIFERLSCNKPIPNTQPAVTENKNNNNWSHFSTWGW